MQKPTIALAVTLAVLVLLVELPDNVNGACCAAKIRTFGIICKDCSRPTPCCGYGRCNVFCCNCDNGCRQGNCHKGKKRSVDAIIGSDSDTSTGADVVALADTNGDGNMTLSEAADYLTATGVVATPRSLMSLDVNHDGVLTAAEIDE